MQNRIEAAKLTLTTIAGGGANLVAVAATAAGLTQQLNQTHHFLYLDIPIWIFFVAAFILAIIGSLFSLLIDLMSVPPLSKARLVINLILGFCTGVVGAFVLLPAFTSKPTMPLLLLTALCMSFLGTVIIRNIGELLRSAELWTAAKIIIKDFLLDRLELLLALFGGGRKK